MKNLLKYAIALSAATVFGGAVVASPAQAGTFAGSLAFSDGADDWFSEVTPGAGDTFDIEFNPFSLNFVTTATGPFSSVPTPVSSVVPSVGTFEFVEFETPDIFIYELTDQLTFDFTNGISVTWGAGTEFMGMFNTPNSLEFMLLEDQGLLATVDGIGSEFKVIAETLQFSDTSAPGGGTYNSQVDVGIHDIPEPATLFGLGVVTAGLVTSRRKKNS
ncbi:MAG: PEP-CTERM sorting domain-containing protein [Cyanobacteriota bacterium]|nr:PEP-CTERM sorting domain-containing protein [Cyanobacteriota bacterium]